MVRMQNISFSVFVSKYFPPFPSPDLIYQNVIKSKVQCLHSISRTCLAQEFGLVSAVTHCRGIVDKHNYCLEAQLLASNIILQMEIGNCCNGNIKSEFAVFLQFSVWYFWLTTRRSNISLSFSETKTKGLVFSGKTDWLTIRTRIIQLFVRWELQISWKETPAENM